MNAAEPSAFPTIGTKRLTIHYAVLILLTAAVFAVVISKGHNKRTEPAIAGGYDVTAGKVCLGAAMELAQSGTFVTISNSLSSLSGSLRLKKGLLKGTVHCVGGHSAQLVGRVSGANALSGLIGGAPLAALLKREPPPPGAPKPLAPGSPDGEYTLAPISTCLGSAIVLSGSSPHIVLKAAKKARGQLAYAQGALKGTVLCVHGGRSQLSGHAAGRTIDLMLAPAAVAGAGSAAPILKGAAAEHVQAIKQRTAESTVAAFFLAVIVVMIFARLIGSLMPRIGEPRVMGEVIAGILLGPTLFGAIAPSLQSTIFPSDVVPFIGVAANLGLAFYMFLIGLEVDLGQLRGRVRMTFLVSNTALLVPLSLGMLAALPLYELLAPHTRFLAFALFVGVSMAVTAFPVLARIISERRMLKKPIGAIALSAAAVDDVSAWFLIALATAVASAGSGVAVLKTIGWAILFCAGMALLVRPLLGRAATAYDEVGRLPGTWLTAIFAGVLGAAFVTDKIGIAIIFGAFVMGLVMPRHAGLSNDVTRRIEDFVLTLLLPLFFAYTGLRTNVALLGSTELILITLGLCAIAILGKYGGTLVAARVLRLPWRESGVLGALMNTRGLTELIVLNLALSMGVISSALFTALVIMALLTTFMAGPILRLLDPQNSLGEPAEVELATAGAAQPPVEGVPAPSHSILVAPQTDAAVAQLLALAEPLARSEPPRELILARLIPPARGGGARAGLQTQAHEVQVASEAAQRERERLMAAGISARAIAFPSANAGGDLARLCRDPGIDLVLVDGRRPLLGEGVPRGDVAKVLEDAPCDAAVLVAREGETVRPGPSSSVVVPFGGADYDWAALELASWIAAATRAQLLLLGASSPNGAAKDASALLADAALAVQQFAGVVAEPRLASPGRSGIIAEASKADLLVVGLSERWRKEGLGEVRRAIARAAPAPIVFVRRGQRPGALAPAAEMTRFGWSTAALGASASRLGPTSG